MKEREILSQRKTITNMKTYKKKLEIIESKFNTIKKEKEDLEKENKILRDNYYAIPKVIRKLFKKRRKDV